MDTLAFGYILPTTGRIRDFNPLETCAARRTSKKACKDSLLKSLQAFFILIPSKLYTDYIIFTPLLQPALRFFWISLRPISDSQLHALPHFHLCPIYLIVSKGSYVIPHGISHLKGGFTLRCLQRLSLPGLATRP